MSADRPGTVAAFATKLAQNGCNILDASRFDDIRRVFSRAVARRLDGRVLLTGSTIVVFRD